MSAIPFVHLGSRSEVSLGESIARVDELCWEAARDEQGYLALTDVNSVARAPEFAAAAGRAGLRAIFGAELNVLPLGEAQFRGTTYRVRLLVENEIGWRTLVRLVNMARRAETAARPAFVPLAQILADPRGLLILLGGDKGEITHLVREQEFERIDEYVGSIIEAAGPERVFIELPDPTAANGELVQALDAIAAHYEVFSVAVPRITCAHAADDPVFRFYSGEVPAAVKQTLDQLVVPLAERRHLATRAVVAERYVAYPHALRTTLAVAEHCARFALPQAQKRFPIHNFNRGVDAESFIWNAAFACAAERYGDLPTRYKERLNREFREIVDAGLANAVVTLARLNEELDNRGVQRGPGAGLLTNSVIASLLGLTRLDPLRFELPFELPAGLGKGAFPILEISIPSNQEAGAVEALDNLFESQISAVGEWRGWRATHCLERAAEVLGRDGKWATGMLRNGKFTAAAKHAEAQPAAWMPEAALALDSPEVLGWLVNRMEGRVRDLVIKTGVYTFSVEPIDTMVPRRLVSVGGALKDGVPVTEWNSEELGRLRHGRISFVHAPLLDLIGESTELVRQQGDFKYSPEETATDDAATYRLLREGQTGGIPPLEKPSIRGLLRQTQVTDLHGFIRALRLPDGPESEPLVDFATILLCHVCAAIKAHRPMAFYAAALSQAAGDRRRTQFLLEEIRSRDIDIAELDINYSTWHWSVERDAIRPGFVMVEAMNAAAGLEIVGKRRELHFSDLADLCRRTDRAKLKAEHIRALVKAGALDLLAASRAEALRQLEAVFPLLKSKKGGADPGDQLSFFDRDGSWWLREYTQDDAEEAEDDPAALRSAEEESVGISLRDIPVPGEEAFLRGAGVRLPRKLPLKVAGQTVTLLGVVGPTETTENLEGEVLADVGGVLIRAQDEVAKRLTDPALVGRRVLFTGKIERDPFQWRLDLFSVYTTEEALKGAGGAASIRLDLSGYPEAEMKRLLALLKTYSGHTPVSMEWLPVNPNRVFRAIAGRRVLFCPLLEMGLDELLGPEEWQYEFQTEDARPSRESVVEISTRISSQAIRRIRDVLKV